MERASLSDRRSLSKRLPINRHSLLAKFSFELGYGKNGVVRRQRDNLKLQVGTADAFDLLKIIQLIGRNAQDTVLPQRNGDCIQKIARENASQLMPPLRPWIRKQKVKGFHRRFRQQIAHCEQTVRAQHPHVFDLLRLAANFLDALGQALNAEKISLRELLCHFAEKRPVAAPKIDMKRHATPKKFRNIQTRDLQFWHEFDHGEKCRHLTDDSTPGKIRSLKGNILNSVASGAT